MLCDYEQWNAQPHRTEPRDHDHSFDNFTGEDSLQGKQDVERSVEADGYQGEHRRRYGDGGGCVTEVTQHLTDNRTKPVIQNVQPLENIREVEGHQEVSYRHICDKNIRRVAHVRTCADDVQDSDVTDE